MRKLSRCLLAALYGGVLIPAAWAAEPAPGPALGVDLKSIDQQIKPGDDFAAYANGSWWRNTEIPSDQPSSGVFLDMYHRTTQRTFELIRQTGASQPAAGTDAARIAAVYTAYMDTSAINDAGLKPLSLQLQAINSISDKPSLAAYLGSQLRADADPINATHWHTSNLFGLFVAQDLHDPEHNIGYLLQGGLGLPDRSYYVDTGEAMSRIRGQYLSYIHQLLKKAKTRRATDAAKTVYTLEAKIAQVHSSLTRSEDVHVVSRDWSLADFQRQAPGLDWQAFFEAAGLANQPALVAWQPAAVTRIAELVASVPLEDWKTYLKFELINRNAPLLSSSFADLHFSFYGRDLRGQQDQRPRTERAVDEVNREVGDAVGKLYIQHYFPASSKAAAQQLVQNLVAAFGVEIDQLSWMSPATKTAAKAKLANLRVEVGYPSHWRDYSGLEISPKDALGNHLRAELYEYKHQLAKLGQPVDRDEWWMTPQTVNAVNLPLQNALNIPAAILAPPFFDPKAYPAANYGAIGAIIGHEISHSFDSTGAEFDAQGKLANWWTAADRAHFNAAIQQLAAQYSGYEALPGLYVNGKQTLGENIADVSGLSTAWLAYHRSLGNQAEPTVQGLSGDQRFFLAYAQAWQEKIRDQSLREQIATDVHAPARFRADTVRNIDAWYQVFGVQPGDKLYLLPSQRVKIW